MGGGDGRGRGEGQSMAGFPEEPQRKGLLPSNTFMQNTDMYMYYS